MMHAKRFFFLLLAGICFLSACNLDSDPVKYTYDNVVLVVNQGNFSVGNGTLSYYYETNKEIENNVIRGYDFGDIIQSVTVSAEGYMFVIGSSKIDVVDVLTKQALATELFKDDLSGPRFMTMDNSYYYITNWGPGEEVSKDWYIYPHSYVLVASRQTGATKKILCGSDAEGIISIDNKLYVATGEGVAVIDKYSQTVVDTIKAPTFTGGAKHFVVDGQKQLWASYPDGNGLLKINPVTGAATEEVAMPVDWMGQLAINADAGKIYTYETTFDADYNALEAKIYELDIATKTHKVFAKSGTYFYSIGVSPATGNVYTAEVNGFSSNSEMLVYDASGTLLDTELTGVGTCDFKFFSIIEREQE
jgi:DNA-binding beta-propeller fold protein YncE